MRRVGLKVLKNNLSRYVRVAAAGETVLVTDRDRVVAELVPPQDNRQAHHGDERFQEAVREGWITPAPLAGAGPPPATPMTDFAGLMRELDDDRAGR
jgi:antitoxin (DNA-binding transcriptional repressor) of toxin-antitoxin stability system